MNAAVEIVESETDGPVDTLTPGSPAPSQVQGGMRIAGFALGDAGSGVGPPWRRRLPLFAGGFGAIIVIVLILIAVTQTGENDEGADPPSLAVPSGNGTTTPTHTPTPVGEGVSSAAPLREAAPTGTPDAPPTVSPTPGVTREPTITSTPKPTRTSPPTAAPTPAGTLRPGGTSTATTTLAGAPQVADTSTTAPVLVGVPQAVSTTTPTHTPMPTNTPEPTPTHTPMPTNTPEPTPTHTLTPTNTPEPTPTHTPTATPTPAPPDLVVEKPRVSNSSPEVWEEVIVTVPVSNQGGTVSGEFFVRLIDIANGEDLAERVRVDGLAAGLTKEITFSWRAEVEPPTPGVALDSTYAEDKENTVSSLETVVPPYVIDRVTWFPEKPAINEDVTFWAHVENTSSRSSEYDARVVFYLDEEYHSSTTLDRRLNRDAKKQVKSLEWKAQRGSHEVLAVLYPSAYLDHRENSSWDEYDERYAISEYEVTYDATRLPNLAVTKMEFLERPVADADAVYLDLFVTITNELGDGGITPSVDDTFDVRIEFIEGPLCPLRPGEIPCSEDIQIRGLRGGSTVTKQVEGTVLFPLPPSGSVRRFTAIVTVDPSNEVEELTKNDNSKPRVHRVTR